MDPVKPSREDLHRAFAVTRLEPELPEETLIAYASGRATELEKELVESMLEVDPTFAEVIQTIREELATANNPLPAISSPTKPTPSGWLRKWFPAAGAIAGLAACGVLVFGLVNYNHALQDERLNGRRLAAEIQANQDKVADLQRRLSDDRTDKKRLVAQLDKARDTLKRELASQQTPTDSVDSLVAHALTKGLSLPAIAEIPAFRGAADLPVSRTPNRTSVLLPVKLAWSGPRQGDYRVVISKGDQEIWSAKASQSDASPPKGLLEPGGVYTWRVQLGDKRSLDAEFRVCTRKEQTEAQRIGHDKTLGPLEKGVVYASLGLVPEAKAQFDLLRVSHPALAERLTKEIEAYQQGF